MFGFKTRKKLIAINNKLVELNKQLGEKLTSAYNERNNLRLDNERLHKKVKIVAITHSLQYQMFYDLQSIAEDIVKRGVEVDIGKVHMLCWEKYQERMLQGPPTYDVRHIDISNLCDPKIIEVLEKEIEYLSNLK